jgi:amidophosphoribosyltransferase
MAAGLFGLSIDRREFKGNFLDPLFLGMFYHQHLGNRGGFVYFENKEIKKREFRGAVGPGQVGTFDNSVSNLGIAYYGDANEPFHFESILGDIAVCFSGNITNIKELREEIKRDGGIFERKFDAEVIAEFIVRWGLKKGNTQREKIINGLKAFNQKAEGAYSLLVLTKERIFAVYGPDGRWPLIIGKDESNSLVVASETAGFSNLGFRIFRELKPGEIVSITNGRMRKELILPKKDAQICDFLWDYTGFPASMFRNMSAANARKFLGACLARCDIEQGFFPHLVIPVPDSGFFHWLGYMHEFQRQVSLGKIGIDKFPIFDEILVKYSSVRSFIQSKKDRDKVAYYKMLAIEDYLTYLIQWLKSSGNSEFLKKICSKEGRLIVVILEDSVVRGTQIRSNLAPKIRKVFAPWITEIHVRASYPVIKSHCEWGKTTQRGEILAVKHPEKKQRIKRLKVDSLECNTREDFASVFDSLSGKICMGCTLFSE